MTLILAHAKIQALELARLPAFLMPTLALPALFFLLFAVPRVDEQDAATFVALYAAFAVLGVAFFQFGVGIAAERSSPWELFLRTLPVSVGERFAARLLVALSFAAAAASLVVVCGLLASSAHLPAARWAALTGILLVGAVPFGLLGIAIGYLAQPRAALPVANLLYLLLAYGGGLWTGPDSLPAPVDRVSPYLPTRQWAELLAAATGASRLPYASLGGLAAYAGCFAALAVVAYRRDEGERFA